MLCSFQKHHESIDQDKSVARDNCIEFCIAFINCYMLAVMMSSMVCLCHWTKRAKQINAESAEQQLLWDEMSKLNILRLRQDGRHFPDDIFKCIFLDKKEWSLIKFSLKFISNGELTIFQHWFRWWLGAGQATSHCVNQWWWIYWRMYACVTQPQWVNDCLGNDAGW